MPVRSFARTGTAPLNMRRFLLLGAFGFGMVPGASAGIFDRLEVRPVFSGSLTNFDFSEDQDLAFGTRTGVEVDISPRFGIAFGFQDFGSAYADYRTRYALTPVLVTPPLIGNDDKERLQARGAYLGAIAGLSLTPTIASRLEIGAIRLSRQRRSDLGLFYFHEFAHVSQTFEDWRPYGRVTVAWTPVSGVDLFAGVGFTGGNGRIRARQDSAYEAELGQPHLRLTTFELGVSIRPRSSVFERMNWSFAVGPSLTRVSWLEGSDWTGGNSLQSSFTLGRGIDLFASHTNNSPATSQYYGRLLELDPVQAEWDGQSIDADTTEIGLSWTWHLSDRVSVRPALAAARIDGWVALVPLRGVILGPLRYFVYLRQWQFTPGIEIDCRIASNLSLTLGSRTHELDIPNPFPFEPARSAANPSARMTSLTLWLRWRF